MIFTETSKNVCSLPYTNFVVGLLWGHRATGSLTLAMEHLLVEGAHEVTTENRDDIIERARIARLEKWPDKSRPARQWEFLLASVSAIQVY